MSYSISCVLLIPSVHRDAINDLADSLGYGPGNLSVALKASDGAFWFGCHTWCAQSFLDQMADPAHSGPAMSALIVSAIEGGSASENWNQALNDHDLSLVDEQ